jgi:hypothetical protein
MKQSLLSLTKGWQSQTRKGSIKKTCKAIKTRHTKPSRKLTQWVVDGNRAFDPSRDCAVVCIAKQKKIVDQTVWLPRRSHHKKCTANQKTKGRSEWAVQVDNIAAQNI